MKTILRRVLAVIAPPKQKRPTSSLPPMPIIVGSPRSGTTLLRFMLDSHPHLAIPPETGFLSLATSWLQAGGDVAIRVFEDITGFPPDAPAWEDFHLSAAAYRREIEMLDNPDAAEVVRLFYRLYASRHSKPRWGDKTPLYCHSMAGIKRLLPEAHFIHIVRDGRDVASSLRPHFFSPGYDIDTQARYWRANVEAARRAGRLQPKYLEIRFEDLLQDTEAILRRVCHFVDLIYTDDMLRYYARTPERLREHLARFRTTGSLVVSREERLMQQAGTMTPPNVNRMQVWRREMSPDEVRRFQGIAGDLLEELGYPLI